ncbi:MAG: hypothetical protein ACM3SW_05540 [Actinomycetota bacterium]
MSKYPERFQQVSRPEFLAASRKRHSPGTKVIFRDVYASGGFSRIAATRLDRGTSSGFLRPYTLFNGHVPEFAGFKHITTFLAFNEFSIFLARHNAHACMPAEFLHKCF